MTHRPLPISPSAYDEITQALILAGYGPDVIGFDWVDLGAGKIVLVRDEGRESETSAAQRGVCAA